MNETGETKFGPSCLCIRCDCGVCIGGKCVVCVSLWGCKEAGRGLVVVYVCRGHVWGVCVSMRV